MTKAPRRTRSPPKATADPRYLPNLIVTCLAPMFFPVCGGDINHARMVAIETVKAYRIEGRADLIVIARIIGFSLAALGCLSLSMADDVSASMTLRLRGNANALHRAAERNRQALTKSPERSALDHEQSAAIAEIRAVIANRDLGDANLAAGMPSAPNAVENARSPVQTGQRAAGTSAPAAAPRTAKTIAEKRHRAMWAIAMVKESHEITVSIPSLPPAERHAATIRAAVLSNTANELLTGGSSATPTPPVPDSQAPDTPAPDARASDAQGLAPAPERSPTSKPPRARTRPDRKANGGASSSA
jgi:hypothetical protein